MHISVSPFIFSAIAYFVEEHHASVEAFIAQHKETFCHLAYPLAKRIIEPLTPYAEKAAALAAPLLETAQPFVEAAKQAPSTHLLPKTAALAALEMTVLYKIGQEITEDIVIRTGLGKTINHYLPQTRWLSRKIRLISDYNTRAVLLGIAAAGTYYTGLALGTPLTLSQLFKVCGSVTASLILCEAAKMIVFYSSGMNAKATHYVNTKLYNFNFCHQMNNISISTKIQTKPPEDQETVAKYRVLSKKLEETENLKKEITDLQNKVKEKEEILKMVKSL